MPAADLPIIRVSDIKAPLQRIAEAGVLGGVIESNLPKRPRAGTVQRPRRERGRPYDATKRLHALFCKHNGLVKPAIKELITTIGCEGHGRHDALVALCGRMVLQGFSDDEARAFLVPLINLHFKDGDRTAEVDATLQHARDCHAEHLQLRSGRSI